MSFSAKTICQSAFSESAQRFSRDVAQALGESTYREDTKSSFESCWLGAIDQGWQACLIAPEHGGLGGSLVDFAALLESASIHGLRLPVLTGFGVPAMLLSSLDTPQARDLLERQAVGEVRLQPVVVEYLPGDVASEAQSLRAAPVNGASSWVLSGAVSGLEVIPAATDVLLACPLRDQPTGSLVITIPVADLPKIHLHAQRIDGKATLSIDFHDFEITPSQVIAQPADIGRALIHTRQVACLLTTVSAAAVMGVAIEQTIQYLRDRQQFGVSLSTFQVLRHYLASAYAKYECLRALVSQILAQVNEDMTPQNHQRGRVDPGQLSQLKVYLGQVGPFVAHTVLQVHGGMGMTEALFASRLNKIILMATMEYGDGRYHLDHLLDATLPDHTSVVKPVSAWAT